MHGHQVRCRQLITALVAVHALGISDVRALRVDDLDRRRGTLRVVRQGREFLVVLDELVLQIVAAWLRVRATRWPATNNPHLLISGHTAHHRGPMSRFGLETSFRRLGITPNQLWDAVEGFQETARSLGRPE